MLTVPVGGQKLQIQRGEFHRHTEISGDGGNDGPLEDMWRYAIDVAGMDWLGCGDHDNGGGREYPWWLTQKTTDAFYLPGAFNSLYTYERSVRYPEGHRNVIFNPPPRHPHAPASADQRSQRGTRARHADALQIPSLLRQASAPRTPAPPAWAPIGATTIRRSSPSSKSIKARGKTTDPGAPRSPVADDAIGGWEPLGFVDLALKKGYRLAFESSSDHGSTHISYALAYAENSSREAIFKAMQQRHVYAATDNIVADFRCGTHMMVMSSRPAKRRSSRSTSKAPARSPKSSS